MNWSEVMTPLRMRRVALVASKAALRAALVEVADAGVVQLDDIAAGDRVAADTTLSRLAATTRAPALAKACPDLDRLERDGRTDLLTGEAQLQHYVDGAQLRGNIAVLTGWCPADNLPTLARRLAEVGAAVVTLPHPPGIDPPTMIGDTARLQHAFSPLVSTYGVVPYRDMDPTIPAGIAYIAMFGMMFGDAGHGALLLAAAALLWSGRVRALARLQRMWVFVAGAGLAATTFGLLYGEFFGPTKVLPVLWMDPLDNPLRLLAIAVAIGAGLLAAAYGFGVVNRWREGGLRASLYAPSGIAGATMFLGVGITIGGYLLKTAPMLMAGAAVAVIGLALSVIGLMAESGGGASGAMQTGIGTFDLVTRLGSNLVSFSRLAAFGMTHAALGWVVWRGTLGLAHLGRLGVIGAIMLFALGNVLTFCLEALVAGIQALRLEYYELFSRIFVDEGNPFHPWRISTATEEGAPC